MKPRPVSNPPNPWASTEVEYLDEIPPSKLEVLEDHTREILARNNSPDICFTWSINPYRGCMHACAYCYARPSHEYLSMGAGTDFETRIVVKPHAPELLREAFERPRWQGEHIVSFRQACVIPRSSMGKLGYGAEHRSEQGAVAVRWAAPAR